MRVKIKLNGLRAIVFGIGFVTMMASGVVGATSLTSLVAGLAGMLGISQPARAPSPVARLGLLIPAYFDPDTDASDWQRIVRAAADNVPVIAIINPDNGPGPAMDGDYVRTVNLVNRVGGRTIGYVYTGYGKRPLSQVEHDVDAYYARYPVDGIFIDEMASTDDLAATLYYGSLANYIRLRHPGAVIVADPGTRFDRAFAQSRVADIFVDEESSAKTVAKTPQVAWESSDPAGEFAEIALQSGNDAGEVATLAQRHIGWVYATTLHEKPNPYARLPADFTAEVAQIISTNASR